VPLSLALAPLAHADDTLFINVLGDSIEVLS
jgi:hypothetical protein